MLQSMNKADNTTILLYSPNTILRARDVQHRRRNYYLKDEYYYKGLHCQRNIMSLAPPKKEGGSSIPLDKV